MKSENVDLIGFNFIKKIKIKTDRTFVRFSLAFFWHNDYDSFCETK